mgnify:CR=1 FL=1
MKWNKYTLKTTTEAIDYISGLMIELGIDGIQIEDNVPLSEEDKKAMFIDYLPTLPKDDGTAYISFYTEEDNDDEQRRGKERGEEGADIAVGKCVPVTEQSRFERNARHALRAVEQEVLAADIDGELQIVEDQSYRFAHAERGDTEVVALEVERDLAEARAEQHGGKARDDEREPVGQAERHRAENGNIRADAHKARVTEREHTGVAREDGEAEHDEQGVAGLNEDAFDVIPAKHIVPPSLRLVFHDLAHQAGRLDDEDEDQKSVHEQVAQVGVEGRDKDLHDAEQHRADDRAGETAETAEQRTCS